MKRKLKYEVPEWGLELMAEVKRIRKSLKDQFGDSPRGHCNCDIQEPNARLIAASPELLEACEELVDMLCKGMEGISHPNPLSVFHKANAAIWKAKGEA